MGLSNRQIMRLQHLAQADRFEERIQAAEEFAGYNTELIEELIPLLNSDAAEVTLTSEQIKTCAICVKLLLAVALYKRHKDAAEL